ncbi:hypothetical protein HK102_007955 [Quaeritorhiza haematococci]|nr:hypothetical protein HK102_007955 [Quaeritorhiza haematococci]
MHGSPEGYLLKKAYRSLESAVLMVKKFSIQGLPAAVKLVIPVVENLLLTSSWSQDEKLSEEITSEEDQADPSSPSTPWGATEHILNHATKCDNDIVCHASATYTKTPPLPPPSSEYMKVLPTLMMETIDEIFNLFAYSNARPYRNLPVAPIHPTYFERATHPIGDDVEKSENVMPDEENKLFEREQALGPLSTYFQSLLEGSEQMTGVGGAVDLFGGQGTTVLPSYQDWSVERIKPNSYEEIFHSITVMKAYESASFEELRLQHYYMKGNCAPSSSVAFVHDLMMDLVKRVKPPPAAPQPPPQPFNNSKTPTLFDPMKVKTLDDPPATNRHHNIARICLALGANVHAQANRAILVVLKGDLETMRVLVAGGMDLRKIGQVDLRKLVQLADMYEKLSAAFEEDGNDTKVNRQDGSMPVIATGVDGRDGVGGEHRLATKVKSSLQRGRKHNGRFAIHKPTHEHLNKHNINNNT